jgi:hypothetical protein
MKFELKVIKVSTINEIDDYWSKEDYIALLEEFNYPDGKNAEPSELEELLEMAMSDFEPDEAAALLLKYKLKSILNEGQIKNLSHEMIEDNESEEYPDPALHYPLFNVNQLLYKAYNGIFPNAKASKITIELIFKGIPDAEVRKEHILKALSDGIRDNNLVLRLYEPQLSGKLPFEDAEKIIWELDFLGDHKFEFITSDYWLNKEDIIENEFSGTIVEYEEE